MGSARTPELDSLYWSPAESRCRMDVLAWLARTLFAVTVVIAKLSFRGLRLGGKGIGVAGRAIRRRRSTTFGSARWGGLMTIISAGIWGGRNGLIVGKAWGRLLRFRGDGAVLVFAPMGAGKGVSTVIPALLDQAGSLICIDPKGENSAITGRHRRTLGPVYEIDAIAPDRSASFNPFDLIRPGAFEADDAGTLTDLLIVPSGADDSHWDTSSKNLIAATILHVLHSRPKELRNLAHVRELIAAEEPTFVAMLETMARSPVASVSEEARSCLASVKADGLSPEMVSVKKNAAKALAIWSKDRIAGRLSATSDFDMLDLHRQTITVFVKVPENLLTPTFAPFLRVMMGCAIIAMVRAKELPRPRHKPLLLLDECAALGRLDILQQGLGWLRAYACTILIWQDAGQIRRLYGADGARSFIAASGAQIAFAVNDNDTARELADAIGMTTVTASSQGLSQANTDLFRHHNQAGVSEAGRYLIDPAEIRRLPASKALLLLRDVAAPLKVTKLRYYKLLRWKGLWDAWRAPVPLHVPADPAPDFALEQAPVGFAPAGDRASEFQTDRSAPGRFPGSRPPAAATGARPAAAP